MFSLGVLCLAALAGVSRAVLPNGGFTFELANTSYLATVSMPVVNFGVDIDVKDGFITLTVINSTASVVTDTYLRKTLEQYALDDVYTSAFLDTVYIHSVHSSLEISSSALSYLSDAGVCRLLVDTEVNKPENSTVKVHMVEKRHAVAPGPYIATKLKTGLNVAQVYRLYTDYHGAFVNGVYPANDPNSYQALAYYDTELDRSIVPVPSRIYSFYDPRPLAGERVGVKDIYDLKGLKTTRGSISFTRVTTPATSNAPSVQRLIDLGAVIVGKQKTAQFASAADPWDWADYQSPFNPRGDGYLTCSSSSAGGGCAIAAYDWLDYSIGSDTGQSVRRPAAVAGVFGNRPSQGLMSTDGVMPITYSTDTLGVLCRDPLKWAHFAKHWYTPKLYQNQSMTHLPALNEVKGGLFPSRLLYAIDYLPLQNPKAETILQNFIGNLTTHFNMTVEHFNFSSSIESLAVPNVQDLTALTNQLNILWTYDQLTDVVPPFVQTYKSQFTSYPPLDNPNRVSFRQPAPTAKEHALALSARANFSQAWEDLAFGPQTIQQCSGSIFLYDIGSGGLPSFREKNLNEDTGAAFLSEAGSVHAGGNICSFIGCADFTVPIGQVEYFSNVTFEKVNVPVTVSVAVRRGCDKALFEFVEGLVGAGVLRGVKTGVDAF
ncbi:amidase family protein [Aspergillus stella-maris]|uniref:amidase family protein n=1 Tax=Aspergillus stella-maris TaxID=1810926 RepID=UPI003CCD17D4